MQIGKYKLCFAFDHIAALLQTLISKIPRAKMDWLDWCRIGLILLTRSPGTGHSKIAMTLHKFIAHCKFQFPSWNFLTMLTVLT